MKKYTGIDGCHGGWISISLSEQGICTYEMIASDDTRLLQNVVESSSAIFVDIPMGLKNDGFLERTCDIEARKLLGGKLASSIFRVPVRPAVFAKSYSEACELNLQFCGKKISKQSWSITSKIRQFDELLVQKKHWYNHLYESHPEICFWALNGQVHLENNKKTPAGITERIAVIKKYFSEAPEVYEQILKKYPRRLVKKDDILDALVLAVSARLSITGRLKTLPENPDTDAFGIPMRITYCEP